MFDINQENQTGPSVIAHLKMSTTSNVCHQILVEDRVIGLNL